MQTEGEEKTGERISAVGPVLASAISMSEKQGKDT